MNLTELCFDFQTLIYVPVTPTHSFFYCPLLAAIYILTKQNIKAVYVVLN